MPSCCRSAGSASCGASMRHADYSRAADWVSFDTETHLVRDGLLVPPIVCGSAAWINRQVYDSAMVLSDAEEDGRDDDEAISRLREWVQSQRLIDASILDKSDALALATEVLEDQTKVLVGANIAYDLLILAAEQAKRGIDAMPAIFRALAAGHVYDLQIAEALHAVAQGTLGRDPRTGGPLTNPETGKRGRYSLATCVDLVLGRTDAKANDEWRLRYAELDGVPMADWPQPALDYPKDDVVNSLECALAQVGHLPSVSHVHHWPSGGPGSEPRPCLDCGETQLGTLCRAMRRHRNLHDLSNQVWTAFAMHAGAAWGFRVDQGSVDVIERHALRNRERGIVPFVAAGLVRADGSENRSELKRRVAVAYGAGEKCPTCDGTGKVPSPANPRSMIICHSVNEYGKKEKTCDGTGLVLPLEVPRSEKDGVSYGRDTLHESGDDTLMSYGDFQEDSKDLSVYVPYLRRAREQAANGRWRDIPLTLRPNVILETGRTSYDGVIQLFKRQPGHVDQESGEWVPSLRECITARPHYVLGSVDYDSGELVTHGQSLLWLVGYSNLADALCGGIKVHNALGATMIGLAYEKFEHLLKNGTPAEKLLCKNARQSAKPGNFGLPGGLGPVKLVLQQRKQGPDTPCAMGPQLIKDDSGNMVRGFKGLRFCILMDGASRCGAKMLRDWKGRPIPPTCAHCVECAVRLKELWFRQWPENKQYFQFINQCVEHGQTISGDVCSGAGPHLAEAYEAGQQLAPEARSCSSTCRAGSGTSPPRRRTRRTAPEPTGTSRDCSVTWPRPRCGASRASATTRRSACRTWRTRTVCARRTPDWSHRCSGRGSSCSSTTR